MDTVEDLKRKIEAAKDLDFGDIFNKSIELFKKTWVQGLLLQLFSIVIMLPIILIVYIPLIGIMIAQQENGSIEPDAYNEFFAGMSIAYAIFIMIIGVLLGTISAALYAAFFRIMKKIDYNETVATSDFFYFIKGKYLSKVFLLMLVIILIAIPSALLCYLPLIYVMVPLSFFVAVFAFNEDLSIGDVVNVSFKLGNKKWLITFGLLVVSYLCVMLLSLITCGLGSLFLKSFLYHPIYVLYKEVIGFDDNSEIDAIGSTAL